MIDKTFLFLMLILLVLGVAFGFAVGSNISHKQLAIQTNLTIKTCNYANLVANYSNLQAEIIKLYNGKEYIPLDMLNCSLFSDNGKENN